MAVSLVVQFNNVTYNVISFMENHNYESFKEDINQYLEMVDCREPFLWFLYCDEDGDQIAVRNDSDFSLFCQFVHDNLLDQLEIWAGGSAISVDNVSTITDDEQTGGSLLSVSNSPQSDLNSVEQMLSSGTICAENLKTLDVLGHGTSGIVYKAFLLSTDQLVTVKCISMDVRPKIQQQIIAEMGILLKCSSPFIIDFYGAFFNDSQISICTEFMDRGSIDKYGQLPQPVLGPLAASVVQGLSYLWSLKIMHRDVKPSNILINTSGGFKLCDFGVSIELVKSIAETYVGTKAYMAPERITGSAYGIYSDIWSFGLSLLEAAIGVYPFNTDQISFCGSHSSTQRPTELLRRIVRDDPMQLDSTFSDELKILVSNCLRKDPSLRPTLDHLLMYPFVQANIMYDRKMVGDLMLENGASR